MANGKRGSVQGVREFRAEDPETPRGALWVTKGRRWPAFTTAGVPTHPAPAPSHAEALRAAIGAHADPADRGALHAAPEKGLARTTAHCAAHADASVPPDPAPKGRDKSDLRRHAEAVVARGTEPPVLLTSEAWDAPVC